MRKGKKIKYFYNIIVCSSLIFLLTSSSCNKKSVSWVYTTEFEIINSSDTGLTIKSWLNNRQIRYLYIAKNSSFKTTEKLEQPLTPEQFWDSDSLEIIFDDSKSLIYSWYRPSPKKNNILSNDWNIQNIGDKKNYLNYTITQEHRDSAK